VYINDVMFASIMDKLLYSVFRYTNVSVGMADVEEGLGVSKPVFPHEVTIKLCMCD